MNNIPRTDRLTKKGTLISSILGVENIPYALTYMLAEMA